VLGVIANLIGAFSGVGMYLHSRSDALLLDGLYTGVIAASVLVALQISNSALAPRSRAYPFGASGQEPLYMLFQSLVILGMVVFAGITAAGKLINLINGGTAAVVKLTGLNWYFCAMVLLNLAMWWQYRRSWRLGGANSDLLLNNSSSALFDAGISAGTGIALVGSPLLLDTPLAFLAPMADPLIVLVLSALFLPSPLQKLTKAVAEAAGVSVEAGLQQQCHDAVAADLKGQGCELVELAMVKLGRSYTVVAYVDPASALSSAAVDQLRHHLDRQMQRILLAPVLCEVIPTAEHPYNSEAIG